MYSVTIHQNTALDVSKELRLVGEEQRVRLACWDTGPSTVLASETVFRGQKEQEYFRKQP